MQEVLQALFLWALTLSGYPDPGHIPRLQPVPYEHLVSEVCADRHCAAIAYYNGDDQTIYIDSRLNLATDHQARSYIVHEMVHYLQDQAGFLDADRLPCEARIELELEAYRVQRHFLKEHNESTHQIDLATSFIKKTCE